MGQQSKQWPLRIAQSMALPATPLCHSHQTSFPTALLLTQVTLSGTPLSPGTLLVLGCRMQWTYTFHEAGQKLGESGPPSIQVRNTACLSMLPACGSLCCCCTTRRVIRHAARHNVCL